MWRVLFLALLVSCAPVIVDTQNLSDVSEQIDVDVISEEVVEPEVVVSEVVTCVDDDGGIDKFVRGRVFNGSDDVYDSCLFSEKEKVRVPLNQVAEYSCEDNNIAADILDCEFGCESGACRTSPRPEFYLVKDGRCAANETFGSSIKVSQCFNNCLSYTACEKEGVDTKSVSLPWQLSCLVSSEQWVVERWVEFEVTRPVTVLMSADVEASEWARVQIYRKGDWFVSSIIDEQASTQNRCFASFSGKTEVFLDVGKYEVRIGSRAIGPDLLRSFYAKDLKVSFI